mgnify:CR=1 FL=1
MVKEQFLQIGLIHFIGIGGIGMSGIAELLHHLGYKVQGSDCAQNANVKRLRQQNIPIYIGHDKKNISGAEVVVVSSAIKSDNVEYQEAKTLHLPIVQRAEMLAEIMRFHRCIAVAGTHGKTTTTSLVAALLEAGHLDPTVVNGGIINAYATNARIGRGDWMVVEADESDGSFLKLPLDVAVVTNIDPEHLDHYGDFGAVRAAFKQFIENIPFYGFAVLCSDHEEVQRLIGEIEDVRIVTYGSNLQADIRFIKHETSGVKTLFDIEIRSRKEQKIIKIPRLSLPMPGDHNLSNAAAAVAVAYHLGVSAEAIAEGLAKFSGVKRRFTHIGSYKGAEIFDDYGHHPTEIKAVLQAARSSTKGRVIAVMQPHRFTRLRDLFREFSTCFNQADCVIVTPVYPAGEAPIKDLDGKALQQAIIAAGHREAHFAATQEQAFQLIRQKVMPEDFVVFLGAGDITRWAHDFYSL